MLENMKKQEENYFVIQQHCWNDKIRQFFSATECVADLDQQIEMIIFMSNMTTFKLSVVFWGKWDSIENRLEPKTIPP